LQSPSDTMKIGENYLLKGVSRAKASFFTLSFFLLFLGVCITYQIALIKLAGGFFYAKGTHAQDVLENSADAQSLAVSWTNSLVRLSTDFDLGQGAAAAWLPPQKVFISTVLISFLILAVHGNLTPRKVYESDFIRIRPPLAL